ATAAATKAAALSLRSWQDLAKGDARGVVDADMDELPAHAATVGLGETFRSISISASDLRP
ncbi:MAG: hypothetical protein J0H44_31160, partial [Alphaproteobacteria bacterium]|nr:hypothetical protein [Alphaproteobacteria bacterium]